MELRLQESESWTTKIYSNSCLFGSWISGYTVPVFFPFQTVLMEYRFPSRDNASTFLVPVGACCRFGRPDVDRKHSTANCSPISPTEHAILRFLISLSMRIRSCKMALSDNPVNSSKCWDTPSSPSSYLRYSPNALLTTRASLDLTRVGFFS